MKSVTRHITGALVLLYASAAFGFSFDDTLIYPMQFGGAVNYSQFETDGTLTMAGTATVWDDLRVEPTSRNPASAPGFTSNGYDTALFNYTFANAGGELLYFNVQMPHSWKEGTGIYPHVHVYPTTTNAGQIDFTVRCSWAAPGGTFATGADYVVSGTPNGTAYSHMMLSNASPVSMSGLTVSSVASCSITRSAADAYTGEVDLTYIDIHYEIDTIGSRTPTGK